MQESDVGGIYIIRLSDTHYYGGRSKHIENRLRNHLMALRKGRHGNRHVQHVWNQTGRFESETLIVVADPSDLETFEQYWLDCNVGQPGCLNVNRHAEYGGPPPMTAETRAKISAAGMGRKLSPEHVARLREVNTGKSLSEETRAKIAAALAGKKQTPERIENAHAPLRGLKRSPESCQRMRENHTRPMLGRKASDETRAKQSAKLKGRIKSEDECAAISARMMGHTVSEETRAKFKAYRASDETKAKQRAAKIGKPLSEEHRRKLSEAQNARHEKERRARIDALTA